MGRREDEGERLAGRLLEAALPLAPPWEECFLLRECEEDRREDEYRGERLRDRIERRDTGLVLQERLVPYGLPSRS